MTRTGFVLMVLLALVGACAVSGAAQSRDLTIYQLPQTGMLPTGIAWTRGTVYTALFTTDTLGVLDLQSDILQEIPIGDGPYAVTTKDGFIYVALALGDQFAVYKPAKSTVYTYSMPTPGGWPGSIAVALPNPTAAHFAIGERLVGRLAYFQMDMLRIPDGPTVQPVATTHLFKQTIAMQPRIVSVQPNTIYVVPSGAVPRSQTTLTKWTYAPFDEWQVTTGGQYLEDVDVASSGTFWMACGGDSLVALDPLTGLASDYFLATGTVAISVDASDAAFGQILFIDAAQGAIGAFDTVGGSVTFWPIPGAQHMVDIARDGRGGVWFADRGADVIGLLDRGSGTFTLYDLPQDSSPVDIAIGEGGSEIWFVAERADSIGKLGIIQSP